MAFKFEWLSQSDGAQLYRERGVKVTNKRGYVFRCEYAWMNIVKMTINDDVMRKIAKKIDLPFNKVEQVAPDEPYAWPLVTELLVLCGWKRGDVENTMTAKEHKEYLAQLKGWQHKQAERIREE